MEKIKVIIVNNSRLFLKCLIATMKKYDDIRVVGKADNGLEYFSKIKILRPDVALLGMKINQKEMLNTIKLSKEIYPTIRLVAFTFDDIEPYIQRLINVGIQGVLLMDSSMTEIYTCIKQVSEGKTYIASKINGK